MIIAPQQESPPLHSILQSSFCGQVINEFLHDSLPTHDIQQSSFAAQLITESLHCPDDAQCMILDATRSNVTGYDNTSLLYVEDKCLPRIPAKIIIHKHHAVMTGLKQTANYELKIDYSTVFCIFLMLSFFALVMVKHSQ